MCYDECNFEDTASAAQILCQEKGSKHFFKGVLELSPDDILKKQLHKNQKEESGKKTACGVKKTKTKTEHIPGKMAAEGPQADPLSGPPKRPGNNM